ncbi:MAG TPA: hypothetical protein ENK80_05640 [Rhodobacterales bacterium]|nr:hypothetical protein [Rhodobacterales bacterium]
MDKLDFKKANRAFYTGKPGRWDRVTLPEMTYLFVEGQGAPEGAAYAAALAALYPTAYGIKFAGKAEGRDFVVPPQSTQWWADDPTAFTTGQRDIWRWRAMIRVPDWVEEAMLNAAVAKKGVAGVGLTRLTEGDCLQTLHVGSYADEAPGLAELHQRVMPDAGLTFAGPHHEVYLSDPRKVAAEKLKTILRQPVAPL